MSLTAVLKRGLLFFQYGCDYSRERSEYFLFKIFFKHLLRLPIVEIVLVCHWICLYS